MTQTESLKTKMVDSIVKPLIAPLVLIVIALLAALILLWQVKGGFQEFKDAFLPRSPAPVAEVKYLIINGLNSSSNLTTAELETETSVITRQDSKISVFWLGDTKLIYNATGRVRAGIDMDKLETKDVDMSRRRIRIILPPPHILETNIDVSRSKVLDHHREWFGPNAEAELQARAEEEALKTINNNACAKGLMTLANNQAEQLVSKILHTAGYKEVFVTTQLPEDGTCPST